MSEEWDGFCAICASPDHCGDLHLTERDPGSEGHPLDLESVRLCTPCFAFVAESLLHAVTRPEGLADVHVPERRAGSLPAGGCQVCHGTIAAEPTFRADLTPTPRAGNPSPLRRFVEHPATYRLCQRCLGWFRDVIDQESASRWSNRRRDRDPQGGTPADVRYRVTALGLGERDQAILEESVADLGYVYQPPALPTRYANARDEMVYFVAAGAGDEATAFVSKLPVTERVRAVVVTSAEYLSDATEALRRGAADLLATPLSRQQVSGAFDRLADPFAVSGRDEASGLPTYWMRPRFGLPCYHVQVTPPAGSASLDTFLVLRRFLRGYDRVGVASDGTLPAMIYCSAEHIDGVVQRMRTLLGPSAEVAIRGHANVDASGDPDDTPRPRLAASAFFGKRLARRAG